ncbi:glutathione S-transferase [Lentibacter sp. XHP0401]|jgi:glutathione S-transferase|uniref:glutathione S-transferase n=1 Tax=Lentibacter sp. XHP0401 TaxID=2984334 RepID=UPI0021E99984|nr:glutathione S-transferase [Lentibacter sp. XHP0401]MCV2894299.1 glutathione S-transferase [Lentibacter sp. XHP0401]
MMTLKLFHSPASPFVRKVLVCAHEKGVADQVELLTSKAWPVKRDPEIVRENPSGQVPSAILEDGSPLFDSRVICAYVDTLSASVPLVPSDRRTCFASMTLEALADTMLGAALLCRYEAVLRPAEFYWDLWHDSQMEKVDSGLDDLEARWMEQLEGPVSIGSIAAACALGYLDFRFAEKDWRSGREALAAWYDVFKLRPSMQATWPE